jgi:hypothetical protein
MNENVIVLTKLCTFQQGPSSGQATNYSLLHHPKLIACHSGAALAPAESHLQ